MRSRRAELFSIFMDDAHTFSPETRHPFMNGSLVYFILNDVARKNIQREMFSGTGAIATESCAFVLRAFGTHGRKSPMVEISIATLDWTKSLIDLDSAAAARHTDVRRSQEARSRKFIIVDKSSVIDRDEWSPPARPEKPLGFVPSS